MKNTMKRWIIALAACVLVLANVILVVLSEDEVERKSYISNWDKAFSADLENAITEEGVFRPASEEYVYFDKELGSFQQFLVEEGEEVQVGDALFEYVVRDYGQSISRLESQIAGLEEEVDALEEYVDDVDDIDVPEPEEDDARPFGEAEVEKGKAVAEAEKELALKEAQVEALEEQLDGIEEAGQVIEVSSPFAGTVTTLDKSLSDPTVAISQPDELVVKGEVGEQNRVDVEEGMKARGTVEKLEQSWKGEVQTADRFPQEGSGEIGESEYSYTVELDEELEDALPGYHSTVYLTVEEVTNAVTVYQNWIHIPIDGMEAYISDEVMEDEVLEEESDEVQEDGPDDGPVEAPEVEGPYAWVMNEFGLVEKRPLTLGMDERNLQEVEEGLEVGEWVADEPDDEFYDGTTFLTPLQTERLSWQHVAQLDGNIVWEYIKMGVIMR